MLDNIKHYPVSEKKLKLLLSQMAPVKTFYKAGVKIYIFTPNKEIDLSYGVYVDPEFDTNFTTIIKSNVKKNNKNLIS